MNVSSPTATKSTTVRPVPKPKDAKRPRTKPVIVGRAAYALAHAQGLVMRDISADRDAVQAIDIAARIDHHQFDPLLRQMAKLFTAIVEDAENAKLVKALATVGKASAQEVLRLDRINDEHHGLSRQHIGLSLEAARGVVAVHEALLTGRAADSSGFQP